MATAKTREKRRAARLRRADEAKLKLKEIEEIIDESDDDVSVNPVVMKSVDEVVEKEYDEPMEYEGPTSWDDMEAEKEAHMKAMQVSELSWTTGDLVRNILHSQMGPEEKGKAISEVGTGFSQRLKGIAKEKDVMKKEYDIELLELDALIAIDKRHTPIAESIGDFISKAVLTTSAEKKLSDDDFALVRGEGDNKERKYPLTDKAHVRNALARAAQQIKGGGPGASDAKAALPKIRAAAKKMGIGQVEKSSSAVVIEKDLSGGWRAVMWPSNNFKDLDGEIISEKAHQEYVEWVNENMELAPVFTTWHKPELVRKSQVDFVGYENGFLMMSAPLTESEAAGLFRVQQLCDIGMSHGTIVMERNPDNKMIVEKYRTAEVSDLPLENAANPFTDFTIISKEADMDTKKYLASLLGEDKANAFLEKNELKQKALRDAGVEEKEAKTDTSEASQQETPKQDASAPDLEAILKAVSERFDIAGLNEFVTKANEAIERVPVLEQLVKDLNEDTDEKLAEKIAPAVTQKMAWTLRPSQSADNKVDETKDADKKLVKSKPVHWLSEITDTEPVEQ